MLCNYVSNNSRLVSKQAPSSHAPCYTGGHEFDGGTEISPLVPQEVQHAVTDVIQRGIRSVVLSGVFSPVNPAHEIAAAAITLGLMV